MRPLTTLILSAGLLLASASPAFADSTLFTHWNTQLLCPHGWHVTIDNDIATMKPDDPDAYPGAPTVLLFQAEYNFPYLLGPEDAATAAFEHLNSGHYVVRRSTAQPLEIASAPTLQILIVEGQIELDRGTTNAMTQEVAVARIARGEDDPGVFAMLLGLDTDAIGWAGTVLGSTVGALAFEEELTDALIRDFRLPATLD